MTVTAEVCPCLAEYLREGDVLTVTGVFSSAVYFENQRGQVLVIHDAQCGLVPFGLAVADSRGLIAHSDITVGAAGEVAGGGVRLGSAELLLSEKKTGPRPPVRPDNGQLRQLLEVWRGLLISGQKGSLWSEDNLFAAASAQSRSELFAALTERSRPGIRAALCGLLGLGTGLTPSLDDYLSALCTLLIWARDVWGFAGVGAEELAAELTELAPLKTSRISAAYLLASAQGRRSERLENAVACPGEVSARALLDVGAGSGGGEPR